MKKNKTKHATTNDTADERILETSELLERVPLDRSTIWRMVQEGRFPKPIQLTRSRIGWRWSAVLAWLAEREANPVEARPYFGRDTDQSAS
jgi:prophage regulatory protein